MSEIDDLIEADRIRATGFDPSDPCSLAVTVEIKPLWQKPADGPVQQMSRAHVEALLAYKADVLSRYIHAQIEAILRGSR